MTHIVNITELYGLVPGTKELEGTTFKDIKHLLSLVIQQVEASGSWEFVQYIQGNPSLFIIREKREEVIPVLTSIPANNEEKTSKNKNVEEEKPIEQKENISTFSSSQTSKLFKDIKIPWKK